MTDKGGTREIPWELINGYVLNVGQEQSVSGLFNAVLDQIHPLIPFDFAQLLHMGMIDGIQDSFGRNYGIREQKAIDIPASFRKTYPYYFSKTDMRTTRLKDNPRLFATEFQQFAETEFGEDWARPLTMLYSIGMSFVDAKGIMSELLVLYRARGAAGFSEIDLRILGIIQPHIANLVAWHCRPSQQFIIADAENRIQHFSHLSSREREICGFFIRGLTAPEIAEHLFISVRTVEKHFESIYSKLDIRNRRELHRMFYGNPE